MIYQYTQTNPTIFGNGAVQCLGREARRLGLHHIMIVTDSGLCATAIPDQIAGLLESQSIKVSRFAEVTSDPTDDICDAGARKCRSLGCDGIVAIGGGSSLDAGKAIAIAAANDAPICQFWETFDYHTPLPVICVPTTAGTGSENTIYGVITRHEDDVKKVVTMYPSLAICDPELTLSLPPSLTAATGMDALSHACEAMTSKAMNPKSSILSRTAIQLIIHWLPVAVKEPGNKKARYEMMLASNFAGMAFSDACCHLGHAVAQCLGAAFHITHGIACAWILPEVMRYTMWACPEQSYEVCQALGMEENVTGNQVAAALYQFMHDIGIPSLKEKALTLAQCQSISSRVLEDNCFDFLPHPLNEEDIKDILKKMYENYQY